jgi:hypothetical protein
LDEGSVRHDKLLHARHYRKVSRKISGKQH